MNIAAKRWLRFAVGADLEGPPELGYRDLEDLREASIDHPRVGLDEPVWDVRDGLAHGAAYGLHRQAGLRREGRVDLHNPAVERRPLSIA